MQCRGLTGLLVLPYPVGGNAVSCGCPGENPLPHRRLRSPPQFARGRSQLKAANPNRGNGAIPVELRADVVTMIAADFARPFVAGANDNRANSSARIELAVRQPLGAGAISRPLPRPEPSLAIAPGVSVPPMLEALTCRQREVLGLIMQGMSNKEIARALNVAVGTVKIHVAALFGKLGVHRRAAVAVVGARLLAGSRTSASQHN